MDPVEKQELDDLIDLQYLEVDPGQEALRIDKFLISRLKHVSRNRVQHAIKAGAITVNDLPVKSNYKVRPGDKIRIVLPSDPNHQKGVIPENIPITIHYEDDDVLVINKEAGMVVHPGINNYTGTLVNALMYYLNESKLPVLPSNKADRPGLVHRLDKNTSGLMVIAKSEYAMTHLAKQFFDHTIERSYVSLVWGNFEESEGTIDGHIARHKTDRLKMHVYADGSLGKPSVTHYKVLEDMYYVSLIQCQLETGRTHQIRVHMASEGHPVFNDERYGGDQIRKGTIYTKYRQFVENCFALCQRQALHAKSLGFVHPITKEDMRFDSELPDDMSRLVDKWHSYFVQKSGSKA